MRLATRCKMWKRLRVTLRPIDTWPINKRRGILEAYVSCLFATITKHEKFPDAHIRLINGFRKSKRKLQLTWDLV